MAKIIVAMSGGVDSSLAAALLHEQGHEVIGVTMHLWEGDDDSLAESLCCSLEMTASARRVCAQLGIPYYVFNYQREFRRYVIDHFVRAYSYGYTPNPCLECNRELKFRALLARATQLGYDYVATGHYARIREIREAETSSYQLLRAVDWDKDQSYMLYMLGQAELARLMFPLGAYNKTQVRAMARERGLASAERPESQDICFVPGGDYRNLLREEAPQSLTPGPIVDGSGREIGRHEGLPLYTIGQRRGLGLQSSTPLYVVGIDIGRNALVVGPIEAIMRERFTIERAEISSGIWPDVSFDALVQIRAHAEPGAASITPVGTDRFDVQLQRPLRAITPGQAAVLYDGDHVLGGGLVARFSE